MKASFKFLGAALLGIAAAACSSPEKMAEQAEAIIIDCNPVVLEAKAGKVEADIAVTYPADYFHPKAILEVTPVIVYEGGEAKMAPFYYQGEKVTDNYKVVPTAGSTVKERVSFNYVEGMEKSYLELRGVVKFKKKSVNLPVLKAADGVNTTYMLVHKEGKVEFKADNYQDVIAETAEGQILYNINSSTVRNSELRSESIKNFQAAIDAIKADERREFKGTDIVAYASPDGSEELNNKLSDNRSTSAEKAFGKVVKKHSIDGDVNVQSVGEDWEGFKELVSESNIEDKDLIIRVLSMYSDPAVREQEIKNMSAVYKTLAKEVLPELRRARFIANVEFTNYTSAELLQLIDENIDILDEEALLRSATLVKESADKIAIYKKAVEKFNSNRAAFNIAVVYINDGKDAKAAQALESVEKDADYYNAIGVLAMHKEDYAAAAKAFAQSGSELANSNAAVLDILNGKYADAAAKLAGKTCFNAALAQLLNGNNAPAAALKCKCAHAAYLRAVAAARDGKADLVTSNLEQVKADKDLAKRAAKDVEFAQYR